MGHASSTTRSDHEGVLMRGLGRWLVYSRARAWLGMGIEVPRLLRGVEIPHGAACLDIATGLGWAGVALHRRDPSARIVALDYDGTILPRTRAYLDAHGAASTAALCRGDGKHLPFSDGRFDLVLCLYGLHHCRGYLEALCEAARVLKPGGIFGLIDPIRSANRPRTSHHGTEVLTIDELARMLGEAGFETVHSSVWRARVKAVARKMPSVSA